MGCVGTVGKIFALGTIISLVSISSVFAEVRGITTGTNINIRKGPDIQQERIGSLQKDESVLIVGSENEWYHIGLQDGSTAYVAAQFVKIVEVDSLVTGNKVNIRQNPSIHSEILGQASMDEQLVVKGKMQDWYLIQYNEGNAYIHKDFISGSFLDQLPEMEVAVETNVEGQYGVVNSNNGLNLRETSSVDSQVLMTLSNGEILEVIEHDGKWAHVRTQNGETGYVSVEFIVIRRGAMPARENKSKGQEIVQYAMQFIGTRYQYGGTSLTNGVDCSGFTSQVMKAFGVSVSRSSRDQGNNGVDVSRSQLMPGDLVFFDTNKKISGKITHVGIFVGNGKFIHASSTRINSVTIDNLNDDYYSRRYLKAVRVVR